MRPRVGVDFHTFDGMYQGSRTHLIELYREAIQLAPEIDFLFFLSRPDQLCAMYSEFRAPNAIAVRMRTLPGSFRLTFQLPWLRLRHRIDLLHMQYRLPLVPAGHCACTIHDVLFESHPEFFGSFYTLQSHFTYRQAARRSTMLFTVSESSKVQIANRYGVSSSSIVLTCNGIDRARFHPGPPDVATLRRHGLTPGNYLLTVGRLEPRKNHATLLRAYARLGPDVPELVIAGPRDYGVDSLDDLVESLRLRARLRFLGGVPDSDLPDVIRGARLFLYPTLAEGFGIPVVEAMACGVPVVTSNNTSLPEIVGDAARLVDPRSEVELAEAIVELLRDQPQCRLLGEKGIARAAMFNWRESALTLVTCYRQFFNQRANP